MSRLRATWAAMGRASRIAAVGSLAVVVIAIAAALVFLGRPAAVQLAEVAATPPPATEPPPLPPTPSPGPSIAPTPLPSPSPPGADALLGTDGRLTVLLLGSDYRPAHPGN